MSEECKHEDQWFDRTICADPCGMMHTICNDCGLLDYCPHQDPAGPVPILLPPEPPHDRVIEALAGPEVPA